MFVLQNAPTESGEVAGLSIRRLELKSETAKFDLTLFAEEQEGGGLRLDFNYNTDLFDAATVERLAGHFEVILAGATADPAARLWDLPLLPAAELRQVVDGWNQNGTAAAPFRSIAQLARRAGGENAR